VLTPASGVAMLGHMDLRRILVATSLVVLLSGCGGHPALKATTPSKASTVVSSSTQAPFASCPFTSGGVCQGTLEAGPHRSRGFRPGLSYRVSKGWQNPEDLEANYELLPPDVSAADVDAGTGDYIGVYRDVTLEDGCATGPVPGLARTPAAMMRHLRERRDLQLKGPHHVRVGGLSGLVADLSQRRTWRHTCPYSGGLPLSSVLVGRADAGLDHPIIPRQTMRLYLLQDRRIVIAVEAEDVRSVGHLAAYSRIVRTFRFGHRRF
jgi:hypothetical protein